MTEEIVKVECDCGRIVFYNKGKLPSVYQCEESNCGKRIRLLGRNEYSADYDHVCLVKIETNQLPLTSDI